MHAPLQILTTFKSVKWTVIERVACAICYELRVLLGLSMYFETETRERQKTIDARLLVRIISSTAHYYTQWIIVGNFHLMRSWMGGIDSVQHQQQQQQSHRERKKTIQLIDCHDPRRICLSLKIRIISNKFFEQWNRSHFTDRIQSRF